MVRDMSRYFTESEDELNRSLTRSGDFVLGGNDNTATNNTEPRNNSDRGNASRLVSSPTGDANTTSLQVINPPSISEHTDTDPDIIKVSALKHFMRTAFVMLISFSLVFFNTNFQVWVDNEALRYFYDVTTEQQWKDFNNSMHIIKSNNIYGDMFPNVLIQQKFGGMGQNGVLPSLEYIQNINTTQPQALLLDDIIFRDPRFGYLKIRYIADALADIIILLTIIFILVLPYFYVLKTMIKRKFYKARGCTGHELSNSTLEPRSVTMNTTPKKSSLLLFPARFIHGLVFARRVLILTGIIFFTRGLTVGLVVLPQESYECIPVLRSSIWNRISSAFLMIFGVNPACHDFVFSGHTSLTTILAWFWITYNTHALFHPKRYVFDTGFHSKSNRHEFFTYKKEKRSIVSSIIVWIMRIAAIAYIFAVGLCLIVSRIHYTMDVVIGAVYGSVMFWLWHALLTLFYMFQFRGHVVSLTRKKSARLDLNVDTISSYHIVVPEHDIKYREKLKANIELRDVLIPITRLTWVLKFVGWCDGYDLYRHDGIGFDEGSGGLPGFPTPPMNESDTQSEFVVNKASTSNTCITCTEVSAQLHPSGLDNV